MQVILLTDVAKVGRRDEIKKVADGFGRNFLIANGKAVAATPEALAKLKMRQAQEGANLKVQQELAAKTFADLKNKTITIKAKTNDEGHLFAGLTAAQIVVAVKKEANINLDAEWLDLSKPLKTAGAHSIKIKTGDLAGLLNVEITKL